jgi:hypothetical protein
MTDEQQQNTERKTVLRSELDLQLYFTDSHWGKSDINQELKDKLSKQYGFWQKKVGEDGKVIIDPKSGKEEQELVVAEESMWSLLGYYRSDLRFGNLDRFGGEVFYCQYYLDLAGDYLQAGMTEPFLICLSRVITLLELSQSRGGFLRRRMNTLSQEHISIESEPKKANLFGKGGGKQDGTR